jgi:photosystem II stability/assembly factor-like uncharacterized protein
MSKRTLFLAIFLLGLSMPLTSATVLAQTGWYQQTSPVSTSLTGVDFVDADNGWICGASGTILRTADGGATWVQQDLGSQLDVRDIDFADLDNGYAVGEQSTIWRTIDGGETWTMIRHEEQTPAISAVCMIDPQTIWIAGSSEGGPAGSLATVGVTTDAGAHWAGGSISYDDGHPCATFALDVAALSAQTAFIACGIQRYDYTQYGLLFKTTNAGQSFQVVTSMTGPNQEVQFVGSQIGIYGPAGDGPEGGRLKKSTDGGAHWTLKTVGSFYSTHMSFQSADLGWVAGDAGLIAVTTDGGTTWTEQATATDWDLGKIQFISPWIGTAVGENGTILHTITGGMTGTDVATGPSTGAMFIHPEPNPFAGSVRLVYNAPRDGQTRIVVFDAAGRAVRELTGLLSEGGPQQVLWDGRNDLGQRAAPGVYFVRMTCSGAMQVGRITLAR